MNRSNSVQQRKERVPLSQKHKRKMKSAPMPADVMENPILEKYWKRRFSLFSKFDMGIKLDRGKMRNEEIVMNSYLFGIFAFRKLVLCYSGKSCSTCSREMYL